MHPPEKVNFREYLYYFAEPELLSAVTKGQICSRDELTKLLKVKDGVKVKEDELAKNLLDLDSARVVVLLPQYLKALELMESNTPAIRDPARPDLQFERGAPTWLRLAWKC